jgi:hypothetical protein
MTPPEPLSTIECTLRNAVAAGAYEEADRLLSRYCKQLETAGEILHARKLLDWMFRMVSAARAHHAAHLTELLAVVPYRSPKSDRLHSWQVEG